MSCTEMTVCGGTPARLFRVSFSGELAYEIAVPAQFGKGLAERLMQAGKKYDVTPYGTEALNVMRIEKGHAAGAELDGRTTALNLNMAGMTRKESDFIGKVLMGRPAMNGAGQHRMIGLRPVDRAQPLSAGACLIEVGAAPETQNEQGWVSSAAYSPILSHSIALGFLKDGDRRHGDVLLAWDGIRKRETRVEVVPPHFYDPEGGRQRG